MSANRRSTSPGKHRRSRFRLLAGMEQLEARSLLAAFTPGNFAVYRVGDGVQTLSPSPGFDGGSPVFVDEYTPNGSFVQSIAMGADTVTGNQNTLIGHGILVSEGMLTRAADGQSLAVPGYNHPLDPEDPLLQSQAARTIGLVGVDGRVDLSTTGTFNKGNNFRGAFRLGDQIYTVGGAEGVRLVNKGASSSGVSISTTVARFNAVGVFDGQLYVSTNTSSALRMASVGSGSPTTSGQTATSLPGIPATGSHYQFVFLDLSAAVAGVDTLYLTDDLTNEIKKFSFSGGTWTAQGAISASAVRGLTGFVSGNSVTLYGATGGNTGTGGGSLYTFTDTTGYNASVSGTVTTIATAGTKTALRGVALVPDDGMGAIGGVSNSQGYSTGDIAILLANSAGFSDLSNFKGGCLTVPYLAGGTSNDSLSIVPGNDIAASEGVVFLRGTPIGTYPTTGAGSGQGGNALTITFNSVLSANSVSAAAVQTLLRQIAFGTSAAASAGERVVELQLRQNDGQSTTAATTINVTRPNQPPTADDADLSTDEDQTANLTLSASDADGDSLSYVITAAPAHGSLSGTAPNLTYTPNADFHGEDSVTFKVNDGNADSSEATISITVDPVNDVPTAESDSLTTDEDAPAEVTLIGSDIDGDSLTYVIVDAPAHGQFSGIVPNLTYTPDADFHGSDSFSFKVNDGTVDSSTATVSITVDSVNDAPTVESESFEMDEDTSLAITLISQDVDGDSLSYEVTGGPAHGTLGGLAPNLIYTPDPDYYGEDTFTFTVSDSGTTSSTANITISVAPVNDSPVLDKNFSPELESVAEDSDGAAGTEVAEILAGVADLDGGAVRGIAVTGLTRSGIWEYLLDGGSTWLTLGSPSESAAIVLRPSDRVRLTPKLNFNGTGLLYFRAWDQTDGSTPGSAVNVVGNVGSATAYSKSWDTAALVVAPVNDAPVLDKNFSPELESVAEDSDGAAGTEVAEILAGVADLDGGAVRGIAVTGLTRSGIWEYSLDGGSTWLTLGSPSESAAIVLRPSDRVRLTPKLNFNGTGLLYFRAWDQTDGSTPGSAVNVVGNVGSATAYSKSWDTAALVVAPVNDAPVLDKNFSPELESVAEDSDGAAGTEVAEILAGVADLDGGAVRGIAVTGLTRSGIWEYSLDGGSTWLTLGSPSESAAIVLRPSDRVRLTPKLNFNGTGLLYFRAWDQTDGSTPGSAVNVVGNVGSATAYSKSWDTAALVVAPVNDAPVLSGISGTIGYVRDTTAIQIVPSAAASDIDSSDFEGGRLRVRINDGSDGSNLLALTGNFTVDDSNQVFFGTTYIGSRSSDGVGFNDLEIDLNANVTPVIATQLIRSIAFATFGGMAGTRKVVFTMSDGDGGTSDEKVKSVEVTLS